MFLNDSTSWSRGSNGPEEEGGTQCIHFLTIIYHPVDKIQTLRRTSDTEPILSVTEAGTVF